MQLTFPSRRVLGLLAAGTVTLCTTLIGGGVAQAAGAPSGFTFDSADGASVTVPDGTCFITWVITGARGGADDLAAQAAAPPERTVTTMVSAGDVFTLVPGTGGSAAPTGAGGTTTAGGGLYDGADGAGATDGGGGAPSVVMDGSYVYLWADGGAGAGAGGGAGGTVTDESGTGNVDPDATDTTAPTAANGPAGRITGTGYACPAVVEEPALAAPLAPVDVAARAGDGSITVTYGENYADGVAAADSWEYRIGTGAWTPASAEWNGEAFEVTLTGLTNGTRHAVRVRGVSEAAGPGAASDPVTATPYRLIGAPASVKATAGPAEVTITWTRPSAPGTFRLAGYEAVLMASFENHGGPVHTCEADPDVRSCTVPAMPGDFSYAAVVYAVDGQGNQGEANGVQVGVVPAPADVPTADGTLEAPPATTGGVTAGEQVTFGGSGYAAHSPVTLLVYSEPQIVGTAMSDTAGAFTATVTLPEGLAAGQHTLVAAGLDPNGVMRYLTLPITVVDTAEELAFTGFDVQAPLTGGLAALGIGTTLIVVSRRRTGA